MCTQTQTHRDTNILAQNMPFTHTPDIGTFTPPKPTKQASTNLCKRDPRKVRFQMRRSATLNPRRRDVGSKTQTRVSTNISATTANSATTTSSSAPSSHTETVTPTEAPQATSSLNSLQSIAHPGVSSTEHSATHPRVNPRIKHASMLSSLVVCTDFQVSACTRTGQQLDFTSALGLHLQTDNLSQPSAQNATNLSS